MDGSLSNWTLSPVTIDNDAVAVGATLREFYKHGQVRDDYLFIFYLSYYI